MPNIKLKDGSGIEQTYTGVDTITVPLADGTGTWSYGITDEELNFNNKTCYGLFSNQKIFDYYYTYKDRMTLTNLTNITGMFSSTSQVPWDVDISTSATNLNFPSYSNLGSNCCITTMEDCTLTLQNQITDALQFFNACYYLRALPTIEGLQISTTSSVSCGNAFTQNYSLRSIPSNILKEFHSRTTGTSWNYCAYYLNHNYTLDKLEGVPVWRTPTLTSNQFGSFCYYNHRVSEIKFDTDNGTPYTANWKNQTIDLSSNKYIGYSNDESHILNYNSGITSAKKVTDATSYAALKDDDDWYTLNVNYSRYNHDSAVNTINSLPDCSAYLATAGGTNTIKFLGTSGTNTDGGAISTLTDEEIAVATAKGWTVTIV